VKTLSFAATAGLSLIALAGFLPGSAVAQDGQIFDELRFGVSASIQSGKTFESGLFPSVTAFFDPFDSEHAQSFTDHVLRPRVHAGAIVSTAGNASQIFAGFTWTIDLTDRFFLDLGFGGAFNNASLHDSSNGPDVGCHALFHESLAAGYNISETWRVLATIDHSSNANLCHDNDGLSYAGLAIGHKF
jgi:lipid A 3-O-deacylase